MTKESNLQPNKKEMEIKNQIKFLIEIPVNSCWKREYHVGHRRDLPENQEFLKATKFLGNRMECERVQIRKDNYLAVDNFGMLYPSSLEVGEYQEISEQEYEEKIKIASDFYFKKSKDLFDVNFLFDKAQVEQEEVDLDSLCKYILNSFNSRDSIYVLLYEESWLVCKEKNTLISIHEFDKNSLITCSDGKNFSIKFREWRFAQHLEGSLIEGREQTQIETYIHTPTNNWRNEEKFEWDTFHAVVSDYNQKYKRYITHSVLEGKKICIINQKHFNLIKQTLLS